jgi:hypothetical protein
MAGNVSAFATVWTYDIYKPLAHRDAPDAHYVAMGRLCTILGVLASIATAYFVPYFQSIMDYVQALFSFFVPAMFGTVLLGILWKRATPAGGFWGLLAGTLASVGMFVAVRLDHNMLAYVALSPQAKDMAENMYRILWVGTRLHRCDGDGKRIHAAEAGRVTNRPGLRLRRAAERRPSAILEAANLLGGSIGSDLSSFAAVVLVDRF